MRHIYRLQKTDGICDIDQVLSALRAIVGVTSVVLLEGGPRVSIVSDPPVPVEQLNEALSKRVPCRLEDGQVQPE